MSVLKWWQRAIFYEIVPHSFQDSDGDGLGDLNGICSRLDYLQWLGIDAIWLGPPYVSPMADLGYDITDHCAIDSAFGTMAEFETFLTEAHRRDIRVILDFVPNHTSERHPWFIESRSSKDNPKRDWYLWRESGSTGPPNNWMSIFGGSAWRRDDRTGEFYLHTFTAQEPDLNWRNPDVQEAMLEVLRFWLEREIDGFRVDACWYLLKDELLRDNPINPNWDGVRDHERLCPSFSEDHPLVHNLLKRMRSVVDSKPDKVLIGELYLPPKQMATYFGPSGNELHLPSNFSLGTSKWTPQVIAHALAEYEGTMRDSVWPNWVLGNHDMPRLASRAGPPLAPVAAILQMTLRGSIFVYYGEEIGMENHPAAAGAKADPQIADFNEGTRIPFRTPMQWDAGANAGFTTGTPWLPIPDSAARVNVQAERADPDSLLNLYRRLIQLRRKEEALVSGAYIPLPIRGCLLPYLRRLGDSCMLIVLNFGPDAVLYTPEWGTPEGELCLSTDRSKEGADISSGIELRAYGGAVAKLKR